MGAQYGLLKDGVPAPQVCLVVRWAVTQLKLATPTVLLNGGKGGGDNIMMSLKQCISIGCFDSEAFSFQEVTKNTH